MAWRCNFLVFCLGRDETTGREVNGTKGTSPHTPPSPCSGNGEREREERRKSRRACHAGRQAKSKGCRRAERNGGARGARGRAAGSRNQAWISLSSALARRPPGGRTDGPASYEHGLFSQFVPVVAIMASLRFDAMKGPHAGHPELFPTIHNVRLVTFALQMEKHRAVRCG